jgi:hypothetical protein
MQGSHWTKSKPAFDIDPGQSVKGGIRPFGQLVARNNIQGGEHGGSITDTVMA